VNSLTIKDITNVLEKFAPLSLQESYDNAGLITGTSSQIVTKALLTLDSTEAVIDEAILEKADLIIAHHPIVFSGLKKFNGNNYVERAIIKAIKNDIAIYACHTNIDNVLNGVNNVIANRLELKISGRKILKPMFNQLCKLHTYALSKDIENIKEALFKSGAGDIGNYDECSFSVSGIGTFRGNELSNPIVGIKGIRSEESEVKLEVIIPIWKKDELLNTLKRVHPYEEVAYEIYPTLNSFNEVGAGLIGELEEEMNIDDFLKFLKNKMNLKVIKHTTLLKPFIKKVAFCGGSGSFLLKEAIKQEADIFITSDIKYHEYFDANNQIILCDIGHFESEQFTMTLFYDIIKKNFDTFAVQISKTNTNPVNYF
jgi:dinuclear metal center YbgI/SA1388 family protein